MIKLGYPDLKDADIVFDALLGHGMFADKLPPCFSSESFFEYIKKDELKRTLENHSYVEYSATRNTNIPRLLAIPHPESYWSICRAIRDNWTNINQHIGKPEKKFSFCHVRKIEDKGHIFEMNYLGAEKWTKEELSFDYAFGCEYVVTADISTFFPSIYTHSIPWAVKGKEWAKIHKCTSFSKKKSTCRHNSNQSCPYGKDELWPNDLDAISRSTKDGETNGILIGPHSSSIISEIILTQVDLALQEAGFTMVIRHIDDFEFFAKNESDARNFLRTLSIELKKYELSLNAKKTKIVPYHDYTSSRWISQLCQFSFPPKDKIGFSSINSYIDHALSLSRGNSDFAALNYAIKVVSTLSLSNRAKRIYVKKMLQIALDCPYIIPLLEDYVLQFAEVSSNYIDEFLSFLLKKSLEKGETDALSFCFYFAINYSKELHDVDFEKVVCLNDCVSTFLSYKYCIKKNLATELFEERADELLKHSERDQDKYWLFLYEILPHSRLTKFLKKLKKAKISFCIF